MAIGTQKQRNIQFALFERIGWGTERVNGKMGLYLSGKDSNGISGPSDICIHR